MDGPLSPGMVRVPEIRRVIEFALGPRFASEARRAREEFEEIYPDSLHALCGDPEIAFIEWFVFDRPLRKGGNFPRLYVRAHAELPDDIREKVLGLSRSVLGVFSVLEKRETGILLREVTSRKEYFADVRTHLEDVEEGYTLTGRIFPWGESWAFSPATVIRKVTLTRSEITSERPIRRVALTPLVQITYEFELARAHHAGMRKVDALEQAVQESTAAMACEGSGWAFLRDRYGSIPDDCLQHFSLPKPSDGVLHEPFQKRVRVPRERAWEHLSTVFPDGARKATAGGLATLLAAALATGEGARVVGPRYLQEAVNRVVQDPAFTEAVLGRLVAPKIVAR